MEKKQKNFFIVIIALLVGLLAAALILLYHVAGNAKTAGQENTMPEFEAQQSHQSQQASVTRGIKIPGYTSIPIKANSKEVEVDLYNPEENEVYFQITFVLTQTEETIYKSKLIEPGQHLYHIELEKEMKPGEYPITIQYSTFSADETLTPRNGATVACVLKAE